jgi:hypothetical protein
MRDFLHRHGQLLAYITLALAMVFTVNSVVRQSSSNNTRAAENRAAIIQAAASAVAVGCQFDLETNTSLRRIIENSQNRIEALYKSGSLTTAQLEAYREVNRESLKQIPVPDCDARVLKFVTKAKSAE